ncbi:LacI family transcriptional regulator [Paenibacillus sp. CC-CFT747]|nr:LacI family transcriptional regulator [Paenibacillus sp. CC-CFT747]
MKKITIKDVAKQAGVSTATISRVLNNTGYVSEEARRTILETIERLNYRPNAIARSLKQDRSRMVGIVLPDMTNPYFMKLSRSLQKRLRESGLHGMFMDTYGDPDMELEALNGLMMMRVEAIVLAGTGRNVPAIRKMVRGSGIPFVLVDRKLPGVAADLAAEENEAAAYEAAADLAPRHEAIGILAGPDWISTARERLDGAAAALRKRALRSRRPMYSQEI